MNAKTRVLTILFMYLHLLEVGCVTEDVDRCATNTHNCDQYETCIKLYKGYRCECKKGFKRDVFTRKCIDIDECAEKQHKCGQNQSCSNIEGGYSCNCIEGHRLSGDNECKDIDECFESGGQICSSYAKCINTKGSYECKCNKGLKLSSSSQQGCIDIDECQENDGLGPCQHRCHNYWGTYRCSCRPGFVLNPNNRTCDDIDECTRYKWKLCEGTCKNVPGSYQCTCPEGYTLAPNERNCIDRNECESGALTCNENEMCLNTRGGAQCNSIACPEGYTKDFSDGRYRCYRIKRLCSIYDYKCLHIPMTYTFNFITFVSNIPLEEENKQRDLFTLRSTSCLECNINFQIKLVHVSSPQKDVPLVNMSYFRFTPSPFQALVSIVRPIKGPQDIQLELSMDMYVKGYYQGTYVSKVYIFVSKYEF